MNNDHADACRAIVAHALDRNDVVRAEMVGVDRFGADYVATMTAGRPGVQVRVPFGEVAVDLAAVRKILVDQTQRARTAIIDPTLIDLT